MPNAKGTRPEPDEYAAFYRGYVELLPDADIVGALESQADAVRNLLEAVAEANGAVRYAPGKWSIKEVVGHLCDTERIMTYRALRIARGDRTPLPGFDENLYVEQAGFARRTLRDLVDELVAVRQATVHFFRQLPEAAWLRRGVANEKEVSVRALAWIIAGHELHHRRILEERYLTAIRSGSRPA